MKLYNYYLDSPPTSVGKWLQARRIQQELNLIFDIKRQLELVVEIGPGHGFFASVVNGYTKRYIALDFNWEIIKEIHKSQSDVIEANTPPFPLRSSSVDLLYASHVIEHMPDPGTALLFLEETSRVLNPGGIVFLSTPDFLSFGNTFWDSDYTHTFPVTERRLHQIIKDANLRLIKLVRFAGPVAGPLSRFISFAARLIPIRFVNPDYRIRLMRLQLTFLQNLCVIAIKGD